MYGDPNGCSWPANAMDCNPFAYQWRRILGTCIPSSLSCSLWHNSLFHLAVSCPYRLSIFYSWCNLACAPLLNFYQPADLTVTPTILLNKVIGHMLGVFRVDAHLELMSPNVVFCEKCMQQWVIPHTLFPYSQLFFKLWATKQG